MLSFVLLNLNCLLNKVNLVSDLCDAREIDLFCMCETWLNSAVSDSVVSIPGYNIFRSDSPSGSRKHGVGIYVKDSVKVGRVVKDFGNTLSLYLSAFDVWIVIVYRPPSYTYEENVQLLSFLELFCQGKELILLGDFNLPNIDWTGESPVTRSHLEGRFVEFFVLAGLTQWVHEPTFLRSSNILDLVLTTELDRLNNISFLPPLPGCGHVAIGFDYTFDFFNEVHRFRRNWYRADFPAMNRILAEIDWDAFFVGLNASDCYDKFLEIVEELFCSFVPETLCGGRSQPWIRDVSVNIKNSRSLAWQNYKAVRAFHGRGSAEAAQALFIFREWSLMYNSSVYSAVCNYEMSLLRTADARRFHGYLRSKKVGRPSVGPLLVDGLWIEEHVDMANCLVEAFSSVFVPGGLGMPFPHQSSESSFGFSDFGVGKVERVLRELKVSSGSGPDGVPSIFLNRCAGSIAYPLWLIFRESIMSMSVPNIWKKACVMPLFKSGPHCEPLNYRPISLTSVCCKSFERILSEQLYAYLNENDILFPGQFGFRSGMSVEHQLLYCYEYVSKNHDMGYRVDVVYFDYKKAFDVVNHGILIDKLVDIGVGNPVLGWLTDFLSGRVMRVVVHGESSREVEVTSGVPQGSVLGPLLFLIYINYVVEGLESVCLLFADDLKLCLTGGSKSGRVLQDDINLLYDRSQSWGLSFSIQKCACLSFCRLRFDAPQRSQYYLGGDPIPNVDDFRDLGIRIDSSLKFHLHIGEIVKRANGVSYGILKGTACRSPSFMREVFITHIRPILEWGSVVWFTGYVGDIRLLESVQRRWTRRIMGFDGLSYGERLAELDLYSVRGRLFRNDLKLVWLILHGHCPSLEHLLVLNTDGRTRGHSLKLFIPRCRYDLRSRFFSVRVLEQWNGLSERVVSTGSLVGFKRELDRFLGAFLFEYLE